MRAVALIPAKDEADRIGETVAAALSIEGISEVLVVDDGSSDETAALAERAGARVLSLESDIGKGAAMEAGASALGDVDALLLLDGDLASAAAEGLVLLRPVLEGVADMTIAVFPPAQRAGFGLVKGLASRGIASLSGGFRAQAPLSGQRCLGRPALSAARPFGGGFGAEVTTTVRVLRAGLRVLEVPTTMSHAPTGRDLAGFVHRGRQFVHVARALLSLALEQRGAG